MNLFYNLNGIGDVLIISLKKGDVVKTTTDEDTTCIYDTDGEVLGVNIFKASEKFDFLTDRYLDKTAYKEAVAAYLKTVDATLTLDTKPNFVIGYVTACEAHSDSDKLSVCTVDIGYEEQIVCGAKNIAKGQTVVVSRVGAMLKSGLFITPSVLRKVASNGMICSKKELDLDGESEGILVLDGGIPGSSFYEAL